MTDGIQHRMFEIHHQTQHLWEAKPRQNYIARHDTLAEALVGLGRILKPFPGQVPYVPEDWTIRHFDPKGRLIEVYDHTGQLVETFTAPLFKRKSVKPKVPVTA